MFQELSAIDVSNHTEKKGKFTYLSWAWAVSELRKRAPEATWEIKKFIIDSLACPYMKTDCGYFVEVSVTVGGIELSQIHPVLNHQNKPIDSPNSFEINTAIQRCLVKAIALHGLGLYIYAGEDLPPKEKVGTITGQNINMERIYKAVIRARKIIDLEDPEEVKTPPLAQEMYAKLSTDEAIEFQSEMKKYEVGNKTAWSVFNSYLKEKVE